MTTSKEEQLNEFFENGMSVVDEQNFLISVAASDELRRAFRSQLELMKAIRSDKDNLRSVAQVRNRTLAALGLSATAAGQFIEHEFLNGEKVAAGKSVAVEPQVASAPQAGMQWAMRLLHTPALLLSAGLLVGILSTVAIEHYEHIPATPATPVATAIDSMNPVAPPAETIPAKNGLHTAGDGSLDNSVVNDRVASGHAAPLVFHRVGTSGHHAANSSSAIKAVARPAGTTVANPALPVISKNNPGVMQSQKLTIIRNNDSIKATP